MGMPHLFVYFEYAEVTCFRPILNCVMAEIDFGLLLAVKQSVFIQPHKVVGELSSSFITAVPAA